ncbi:hypothetical protein Plhal304r1_c053g0137871 [Plasmopara halstedii]
MLDHLLPLIYREHAVFKNADKENYGYIIRRRSRSVSPSASTVSQTAIRPQRRSSSCTKMKNNVASTRRSKRLREASDAKDDREQCTKKRAIAPPTTEPITSSSLKRRREASDDGNKVPTCAKKHRIAVEKKEYNTRKRSLKRRRETSNDSEVQGCPQKHKVELSALDGKEPKNESNELIDKDAPIDKQVDDGQEREKTTFKTPVKKPQEVTISAKKATKKVIKVKKVREVTKAVKDAKSTPKRLPLQDITHLYVNGHTRSIEDQRRESSVAGLTTSVSIRFF